MASARTKPHSKSVWITGISRRVARIATADREERQRQRARRVPSRLIFLLIVLPACTHTKKREQLRFSGVAIRSWLFVASRWDPSNDQTPLASACFPPVHWHSVFTRLDGRVRR